MIKVSAAALLLLGAIPQDSRPRPVVAEAAALPRSAYRLPMPPSALIDDRAAILRLASDVDAESRRLLEAFDIRDEATRRNLLAARRLAALTRGDPAAARDLETTASPDARVSLATDLLTTALLAAEDAPSGEQEQHVRAAIRARLADRGPETRGDAVALRREWALASSAYRLGELSAFADPEWQRDPQVNQEFAVAIMRLWVEINLRNPWLPVLEAELETWLDGTPDLREDVWRARALPARDSTPPAAVGVGIWDGIDPILFADHVRRENDDPANGWDDDGDGFVDEREGLAFDEAYRPIAGALADVTPFVAERLAEYERYMRGVGDLAAGRRSADVEFARAWRRGLQVDEVKDFEEGYVVYADYVHGTRVTGIALRDLPAARLVPVRITFPQASPPPVLDEAAAARFVAMVQTSIRYMRMRGVRVCNISWGFAPQAVEDNLTHHGLEPDPEARAARARRIFAVMFAGMEAAMREAPEILFVVAAGNSGDNIDFVGDLPGGINLPNVLTVGAADIEGRAARFASGGVSVDLFALGTDVESIAPGGGRFLGSGASLAAPEVVNVAARLLEQRPDLCGDELAEVLRTTATPLPGDALPLLNGRAAWEALGERGLGSFGTIACPAAGSAGSGGPG